MSSPARLTYCYQRLPSTQLQDCSAHPKYRVPVATLDEGKRLRLLGGSACSPNILREPKSASCARIWACTIQHLITKAISVYTITRSHVVIGKVTPNAATAKSKPKLAGAVPKPHSAARASLRWLHVGSSPTIHDPFADRLLLAHGSLRIASTLQRQDRRIINESKASKVRACLYKTILSMSRSHLPDALESLRVLIAQDLHQASQTKLSNTILRPCYPSHLAPIMHRLTVMVKGIIQLT